MIDDKELLELFKVESGEHIQRLDEGFLRLEKETGNLSLIADVMREAHSLKGAARMLGLSDIERLSHQLEDILNAAKKGAASLSPEAIDGMYKTLDEIKKLVNEAIMGEAPKTGHMEKTEDEKMRSYEVKESTVSTSQQEAPPPAGEAFRIETVRVDTRRLDSLMTHAGELSVTQLRISRRPAEIEEIIGVWEKLRSHGAYRISSFAKNEIRNTNDEIRRISSGEMLGSLLNKLRMDAEEDSSRLEFISNELEDGIRTIRLLPLSTIFSLFPRMVRDMAREKSKEINLVIEGGDTTADKRIIEEMKDPLMHMLRNSIDHGIESPSERGQKGKPRIGTIALKAYQTAANIVIEVKDDGRGLDPDVIKRAALKKKIIREEELAVMTASQIQALIFVSGFSTSSFVTDVSGRGVGLDVVRNNVENLKGTIQIESDMGKGCALRVQLPITLATTRVLIAGANGRIYAIPVVHVLTTIRIPAKEIFTIEGRNTVVFEGSPLSVARLPDLLELRSEVKGQRSQGGKGSGGFHSNHGILESLNPAEALPCIILSIGEDRLGILVDELLDEQEVVLKQQSLLLKRVRNVSGTTILGTGEVCTVLNPQDLIRSAQKKEMPAVSPKPVEEEERKKSILLAEDSLTTRAQLKRILEGAGYEVEAAVDGAEAFNKLGMRTFDVLVTDILMPNMDGLTLTGKIRQDRKYKELPIILVTSLASDEDRKRGLEAGANAYITKPAFDQKVFLETLRRLI